MFFYTLHLYYVERLSSCLLIPLLLCFCTFKVPGDVEGDSSPTIASAWWVQLWMEPCLFVTAAVAGHYSSNLGP